MSRGRDKGIVTMAVLSLPLMVAWFAFDGIDNRVDWFLFRDFYEKPKWIISDAAFLISNIILTGCIHLKMKGSGLDKITLILLSFAIFRLLEYFTFRGSIPMLPIIAGIIVYSLCTMHYKK